MFSIVYIPGPLTREFFQVRPDIVNSVSGGRVRGGDQGACAEQRNTLPMQALPGFRDFLPEDCAGAITFSHAGVRSPAATASSNGKARLWRRPSYTRRKAARKLSSSFSISQTKANAKSRCVLNSRPRLLVWLRRTNANSRNHSNGSRSDNFSDTRSNSAAGCANIFSSIATSSARRISPPTSNWSRFALISCVRSDSPKKISWSGSAIVNSGLISSAQERAG